MPIDLEVSFDLEDVLDGFNEMSRAGRDLRRAWRELKPVLKVDIREHFRAREGPDGKWPPLAASTKEKRKAARGGRRRRGGLLGKLRTAFTIEFDEKELRAESRVPEWASAHQDGATVGRGAKLPKRTHIWMSNEFIDRAVERLIEHITRRW